MWMVQAEEDDRKENAMVETRQKKRTLRPLQHRVHRNAQPGWCDQAQYSAVKNNVQKNSHNETIITCGERTSDKIELCHEIYPNSN